MTKATPLTVEIRYDGRWVRILGDYTWKPDNGYLQDVDIDTAAGLLTYPKPQFTLNSKPKPAALTALAVKLGVAPSDIWPADEQENE